MMSNIQAAKMLGWTSLALGAAEIAATHWVGEQIGVDGHEPLIRAFGVREIAAGVTILAQPGLNQTLAAGLWARVAGDVLDLAALSTAANTTRRPRGWAAVTGFVLAATGLDILVASRVQKDLSRAAAVSEAARRRVTPAAAIPDAKPATAGLPGPAATPA